MENISVIWLKIWGGGKIGLTPFLICIHPFPQAHPKFQGHQSVLEHIVTPLVTYKPFCNYGLQVIDWIKKCAPLIVGNSDVSVFNNTNTHFNAYT